MAVNPPRADDGPRALAEVRRTLDSVTRDPFLNARTMEITLLNGVTTTVRHGLGHPYTNYVINLLSGAIAAGYILEDPNTDKMNTLKLTANSYGADVVARLTVW